MSEAPSSESNRDPFADQWDAYLTQVDGDTASVLVNLAFADGEAPNGGAWLHQWALPMRDPGPHGLGTLAEAEGFEAVEGEVTERLAAAGFLPVGRERYGGHWKLSYYAQTQREAELTANIEAVFGAVAERVVTGVVEDLAWAYYFEVLCPDAQQSQWMRDRDQVLALRESGEGLGPHEVEHFCYFETKEGADVFSNEASAHGFACEVVAATESDAEFSGEYGWMVSAKRADAVELAQIHVVVMTLFTLAEDCGGAYDSWEAGEASDAE